MKTTGPLVAGLGVGAGLVYFLDPSSGARRRARVRDRMTHTAVSTSRAVGTMSRDALHRTYGTATSFRKLTRREPVEDEVLVARARAKLGRLVSHPHAVEVGASNGTITLSGPILEREAPRLVRGLRRLRGVRDVIDCLERHERAGNIPSLQGGRAPAGYRIDILQPHWAPTTRAIVGTAGAALVAGGARRRGLPGAVAALVGIGLIGRALANVPLNRLTGVGSRRRAVDVQKTITIDAPLEEVYAFWSLYENFPLFMSRVLEVSPYDNPYQSRWKVSGPAGVPVEFDAEITWAIPNELIGWRTLKGSPVEHEGVVQLEPDEDGGTRVHVQMSYNPPAGWLGHGVALAFGADPKRSMDIDLVRMKTLIETGRAPHDSPLRGH
jgi:uncharacterized membrane protein